MKRGTRPSNLEVGQGVVDFQTASSHILVADEEERELERREVTRSRDERDRERQT